MSESNPDIRPEVAVEIQERNLDILARQGGFKFTDTFVIYTSGEIGPYYVQAGVVQNFGPDFEKATRDMTGIVRRSIEERGLPRKEVTISGGETRDWIFSNPVALELRLPHTMLYKGMKTVGASMEGKQVLHVADLNNEGSSPRDHWIPTIKKAGGTIEHIFFYVDRMEDGVRVMEDLGLVRHALVPLDKHAWDHLNEIGVVSTPVYMQLRSRMLDKGEWARTMLRSDVGYQTYKEFYTNPKTTEKAVGVLMKGYPYLIGELAERLERDGVHTELLEPVREF